MLTAKWVVDIKADIKEWAIDTPNEEKIIHFVQAEYTLTSGSKLKSLETFFNQIEHAVPVQDRDATLKAILCRDPLEEATCILSGAQCLNLVYVTAKKPDITRMQRRDAVKSVKLLCMRASILDRIPPSLMHSASQALN